MYSISHETSTRADGSSMVIAPSEQLSSARRRGHGRTCQNAKCHRSDLTQARLFFPRLLNHERRRSRPVSCTTRTTATMEPPRRGTLRPSTDPYSIARSGLPAPMSTVKKLTPSGFRQSLAGPTTTIPARGSSTELISKSESERAPKRVENGQPSVWKNATAKVRVAHQFRPA